MPDYPECIQARPGFQRPSVLPGPYRVPKAARLGSSVARCMHLSSQEQPWGLGFHGIFRVRAGILRRATTDPGHLDASPSTELKIIIVAASVPTTAVPTTAPARQKMGTCSGLLSQSRAGKRIPLHKPEKAILACIINSPSHKLKRSPSATIEIRNLRRQTRVVDPSEDKAIKAKYASPDEPESESRDLFINPCAVPARLSQLWPLFVTFYLPARSLHPPPDVPLLQRGSREPARRTSRNPQIVVSALETWQHDTTLIPLAIVARHSNPSTPHLTRSLVRPPTTRIHASSRKLANLKSQSASPDTPPRWEVLFQNDIALAN
ncbi:hypothetical protein M422DRAFT_254928 [Sphaerobolus stellatus SS14]|uniref:Unplaced genomic scaffold SPHSTscaffold_58, whole genome shotgun sequence n=1 Tax=Sphaerobolus stellatus (strain SS14) TaxID=990650 RepID=A0A0C9VUJ2_SPHS4|nr:hypothetical protein M422DRAFT_254928 [Sphaerobolus stellatus SS14]